MGEVERAFFEPNGRLSVVQAPQYMRKETDQPLSKDYRRRET